MLLDEQTIRQWHYEATTPPPLWLRLLETPYALGVSLWNFAYDKGLLPVHRLSVPVISIGNLTTGGTGKTPLVIDLVTTIESLGLTAVVLSRGYKAAKRPENKQQYQVTDPSQGDEAYLMQQSFTRSQVWVGRDRVKIGKLAIKACHPDVIILDDGFQHRRLHRDLDIVLVDGQRGLGNTYMLPTGPLREPINALKRASIILHTKSISASQRQRMMNTMSQLWKQHKQEKIPIADCPYETTGLVCPGDTISSASDRLTDAREKSGVPPHMLIISGIAHPESFQNSVHQVLRRLDASKTESSKRVETSLAVITQWALDDHHLYTPADVAEIEHYLKQHTNSWVVTTTKDWIKLSRVLPKALHHRVFCLTITPVFSWKRTLTQAFPHWQERFNHIKSISSKPFATTPAPVGSSMPSSSHTLEFSRQPQRKQDPASIESSSQIET